LTQPLNLPERFQFILVLPYSVEERQLADVPSVHVPRLVESLGQRWQEVSEPIVLELLTVLNKLSRRPKILFTHGADPSVLGPTCMLLPPLESYLRTLRLAAPAGWPKGEGLLRVGEALWDQMAGKGLPNEL